MTVLPALAVLALVTAMHAHAVSHTTVRAAQTTPTSPADPDGDGVLAGSDRCPRAPAGLNPNATRPGCPLPDDDDDQVPDATDHCRRRPGAPTTNAATNGCPGLVRIARPFLTTTQTIHFATDANQILPVSFAQLAAVADALVATPGIRRLEVQGHTDNRGSTAYNAALSQRRAVAVREWLIAHGVDAGRLDARGYGSSRPLVANITVQSRTRNRRIDFLIVDPAVF